MLGDIHNYIGHNYIGHNYIRCLEIFIDVQHVLFSTYHFGGGTEVAMGVHHIFEDIFICL